MSNVVTVSVPILTWTMTPTATDLAASSVLSSSSASATPAGGISNGTSSQSSGQGQQQGGDDEYDAGPLMYHADLLLLCLIGLFILLRAPRVLARLRRPSNWWQNGHILRSVTPQRFIPHIGGFGGAGHLTGPGEKFETVSAESHTLHTHEYWYTKTGQQLRSAGPLPQGPSPAYPLHLSACPSFMRSLIKPLSWRVVPGFSLAQALVCLVWLGVTLYTAIYKSPGPFTDPTRPGWIAGAQLPFVFAFASKNNVLSALMGLGYEKLNFMHRFVGTAVVACVNIHTLGYFYKWLLNGNFAQAIAKPSNYWGLVAAICMNGLWLFSFPLLRKKAYNVFLITHVISFSVLLPASYKHKKAMIPYVYAAIAVYGLDHILRVVKTRFHTAVLRPLPELGTIRVEIRGVNSGWRAGQHVRLRVFSAGMGIWGWTEAHPFTIANATGTDEGMVLMIKKAGGWTNKLYEIAKAGEYSARRSAHYDMGYAAGEAKVKVMVEGPYGGPGPAEMSGYSAAVLVCGGSGIAFGLAALEELIRKDTRGQSRLKLIELVWIARDPAQLTPLLPRFLALVQESLYTPVRISIFYTRAAVGQFPFSDDFFKDPAKLNLSPGRPKIGTILESTVNRTVAHGSAPTKEKAGQKNCGVIVGVCGPPQLADDVAKEVGNIDPTRRDQVGGVEVYEEVFGW